MIVYQAEAGSSFTLKVLLPGGKRLNVAAYLVTVQKEANDRPFVRTLHVNSKGGTLQEMRDLYRGIASDWDLPMKDFDQWYDRVTRDPEHPYLFETMRNDLNPSLSVAFKHSLVDARPWALQITVTW